MPVRKIPPKQKSLSGIHAGAGKQGVAFESSLERDFITLMLFDDDFISIEEQPVEVPVPGKRGRASYYVPDFLVYRRNRPAMLAEIKPTAILQSNIDQFKDRFDAARRYANDRDWEFSIWTENEIRCPRLDNAKFLLPFKSQPFDDSISKAVQLKLSEYREGTEISKLAQCNGSSLAMKGATLHTIWCLIAIGALTASQELELTMESTVKLAGLIR
jgi:hypothetical protein